MAPTLSALGLACVDRITDAGATAEAGQSVEQPRHASLAVRTMQPWPAAAEMAPAPRNPDLLRRDLIEQYQLDQVPGDPHLVDPRPPQRRPQCNPTVPENVGTLKLAHVQTIGRQFFDRQSVASLVSRHGAEPNDWSRCLYSASHIAIRSYVFQLSA